MTRATTTYIGGTTGSWHVMEMTTLTGRPLEAVTHLSVRDGLLDSPDGVWALRGISSNERYVERDEKRLLMLKQPSLGRFEATCAALIPIKKSVAWWNLAQDERRAIFEAQSQHIRIGMNALPAIARRLLHCRDIGVNEPFDFLTWFEYSTADTPTFDRLLSALRSTREWTYVEREIDIRLLRCDATMHESPS